MRTGHASAYQRVARLLEAGTCVVLDGGVATELQRATAGRHRADIELWGTWGLYRAPDAVLGVHRRYVAAGCDVVSTDTWSILSAPEVARRRRRDEPEVAHWMGIARRGVDVARRAVAEAGREGECAVAFTISEEIDSPERLETVRLLARVFEQTPPDLILLETLSLIRPDVTFETVEALLETGLPVWLGFRRCRRGVCGVHGQHWGPPESDLFGRAARRFEEMGVGALLINCLPVDHVPGMLPWLRDFTDMPLGVYPNLGYFSGTEWVFDDEVGPEEYAELAVSWRDEGAQIVGGCCGVGPEHIAAAGAALADRPAGTRAPLVVPEPQRFLPEWTDARGTSLFPVPFPELTCDEGVFVPTSGSFLVWKHLFETGTGRDATCLDVGCGCGILSVQLALNGARRVHAIDIDRNAVANTLANGFRNGVADRLTGEALDLYKWRPNEKFDLVVASLYQMPVDPYEQPSGHRPLDFWGRTLLDHFVSLLPSILNEGGKALVMQLSILSRLETAARLEDAGFSARVVDFSFFPFGELFRKNEPQIRRVEELSDAYHVAIGTQDVLVAYLLEVTAAA
jgi:S-methylmethionine-dependent homocysteine/selenocysteine methylase/SAM-dependent methyltransferase